MIYVLKAPPSVPPSQLTLCNTSLTIARSAVKLNSRYTGPLIPDCSDHMSYIPKGIEAQQNVICTDKLAPALCGC